MHVLRLINDLLKHSPRPSSSFTNLAPLLEVGLHTIKQRSLVFVISDFISAPGWERPLKLLSHRHEVLAVRLWDPREVELPDMGTIIMEDAETGEQLLADTSDPLFHQRLRAEVDAREAAIDGAMARAGVTAHRVGTDEDLVTVLVGMVHRSRRRRP